MNSVHGREWQFGGAVSRVGDFPHQSCQSLLKRVEIESLQGRQV